MDNEKFPELKDYGPDPKLIDVPADVEMFELVEYTGNEDVDAVLYADSLVNSWITESSAGDIFEEMLRPTYPDTFMSLSPSLARPALEILLHAMVREGGWSVPGVVEGLKMVFPTADDPQLRRIVRNESARMATMAHEVETMVDDPCDARYEWREPRGRKACEIHQAILDRQPAEGLRCDRLKASVAEVAGEFGVTVQDDWMVHPDQRGSFARAFVETESDRMTDEAVKNGPSQVEHKPLMQVDSETFKIHQTMLDKQPAEVFSPLFWRELMSDMPLCFLCKRLALPPKKGCEAYPEKIPDDIWNNNAYHVLSYPGDNGIMFDPVNGYIDVQAIIDAEKERRAENDGTADRSAPSEEVPSTGNQCVDR